VLFVHDGCPVDAILMPIGLRPPPLSVQSGNFTPQGRTLALVEMRIYCDAQHKL
jgi:hypothetical protein